jgi:hypothetical protein
VSGLAISANPGMNGRLSRSSGERSSTGDGGGSGDVGSGDGDRGREGPNSEYLALAGELRYRLSPSFFLDIDMWRRRL